MMQAIKSKRGVSYALSFHWNQRERDGISCDDRCQIAEMRVSGSDIEKYIFTQQPLEERHIPITSFSADNIHEGDTVIIKCF